LLKYFKLSLIRNILILGTIAVFLSGCAMGTRAPVTGFLYTDAKGSLNVSANQLGSKKGTSCATSILGWIGMGDASIATAASNGGITRISNVDSSNMNILGLYAKTCTIVQGD